jgi:quercetin dioxygenase-like cupin family protein
MNRSDHTVCRPRIMGTIIFCLLASVPVLASGNKPNIHNEVLVQSVTTWNGEPIRYPMGTAEVTSAKVTLERGAETPFHCHPVPTVAYIMSGILEVQTADGKRKRFKQGESMAEVINTWHKGKAVQGPVEIVVFYAGSKGVPTTINPRTNNLTSETCTP